MEYLIKRLTLDHQIKAFEALALPEAESVRRAGLEFAGSFRTGGALLSVGLVRADGLSHDRLDMLSQIFVAVMGLQNRNARSISPEHSMGTRPGSCGVLCFVFQNVPAHRKAVPLQNALLGSESFPENCVSWAIDVRHAMVHSLVGQPLETPLGTDYLERLLREYQAMTSAGC